MMPRDPRRGRARSGRMHAASPEVIAAIVALRAAGAKQMAIADELGVSQAHVCKVLRKNAREAS